MYLIGLLIILFIPASLSSVSPASSDQVSPFHVEGMGAQSVLSEVGAKTGITIGLQTDTAFGTESLLSRDFPGGSREDLARMCASLIEHARWTINKDGSINITSPGYAATAGDVAFNYSGGKATSRQVVWNSLEHIETLNSWMNAHKCKRTELLRGREWHNSERPFDLPSGKITLSKLLETATFNSNGTFWSIINNDEGGECQINIRLW